MNKRDVCLMAALAATALAATAAWGQASASPASTPQPVVRKRESVSPKARRKRAKTTA